MKYQTALMSRFYDETERLFVEEGLSPQAIHLELRREHGREAPSRRTIYVWSADGDWEAERRRWAETGQDIQGGLVDAIRVAIRGALANPNRDSFSALKNAMSSARMFHQMRAMEGLGEEVGGKGENTEDIEAAVYEMIEQKLGG